MDTTTTRKRAPGGGRKYRQTENLPNRLREFRNARGLTVDDLAAQIGVSVSTLTNAELYGRSLGKGNWYKLADFFKVDPRVLEGRNI